MGFKYELEISALLVKEDGGYWSKTPLNEFLAKCTDPRNIKVYITENSADEPKQIPASVKIKRVIVDV